MRSLRPLAFGLALLALSGVARAESPTEARLREALRSAQAQLKALEDERAAARSAEAALQAEVEALRAQAGTAARVPAEARRLAGLQAKVAELNAEAKARQEALVRCEAASQQAGEAGRAAEAERARAGAALEQERASAAACQARNARLYRVGKEVLDWLSGLGVAEALAAREPFLGFKRVELENAAQDFEDRLLEQRVAP